MSGTRVYSANAFAIFGHNLVIQYSLFYYYFKIYNKFGLFDMIINVNYVFLVNHR